MHSKSEGFTLIELLVVVAIIALLMAVLIPSLNRAKEQAKALQCASSMRQVGQIVAIFAMDHDNRSPGGGEGRLTNQTSLTWNDVLNAEVMGRDKYAVGARFGSDSAKTSLFCPNYTPGSSTDYARPMGYNADADSGGDADGLVFPIPAKMNPFYPDASPVTSYYLGAKLSRFRSDQYMLVETYGSDDVYDGTTGDSAGRLTGQALPGPAYVIYGTNPDTRGYGMAFRHPFLKGANFLYFDGHVQFLHPRDDVADHLGSTTSSHWRIGK